MNTKVYNRENEKTRVIEWWWQERIPNGGVRGTPHGPFDTRDEADDAARAARITARGVKART